MTLSLRRVGFTTICHRTTLLRKKIVAVPTIDTFASIRFRWEGAGAIFGHLRKDEPLY
jgi:hypothetical protein